MKTIINSTDLNLPKHISFIVDGNRRWAKLNKKSVVTSYKISFERIKNIITYAKGIDVPYLSFFVLSTENLRRDKYEIDYLMSFFCESFKNMRTEMVSSNVKIIFSGRKEGLPDYVTKEMNQLSSQTQDCNGTVVNFCINYGGKSEIADACQSIARQVSQGQLNPDDISLDTLEKNFYNELPPVDFVIRTSGEKRISNFMIWHIAYAEFYFLDECFPDFDEALFHSAIDEFGRRTRRFGVN